MRVRVWSLNGARFAGSTPEEEAPPLRWLRSLSRPGAEVPDVLCLQDFRVSLVKDLRAHPYVCFVPMTHGWFFGQRETLGICIAARWPMTATEVAVTWGDGIVRDLEGVDETNERCGDYAESDRLVLATHNRVVAAATVRLPGAARGMRVATHHGFWTRDGAVDEAQLASTRRVATFLARQAQEHDGVLYMADINPDKEGQVRAIYAASGAVNYLPRGVRTTLASRHPAASLGIRSDCAMGWAARGRVVPFSDMRVEVDDAPRSDHLLVKASFSVEGSSCSS